MSLPTMTPKHGFTRRLLLALLVAMLAVSSAAGAKIHVIIAGDTLDKSIGTAAQESTHDMFTAFYCNVPEPMLEIEQIVGEQFTEAELVKCIDQMRVGSSDVLVLYVFSHGQYDEKGHYFVDRRNSAPIYRANLLAAMERKKPRFRALISDSCNMYLPTGKIERAYVAPAFRPADRLSPMFVKLFFGYRGLLDVNSSSKDQPALCIPRIGGLFSMTLSLPYDDEMLDNLFETEIRKNSRLGRTLKAIKFKPGLFFLDAERQRTWEEVLNYSQNQLGSTFLPVYESLNVNQKISRITMPKEAPILPGVEQVTGGQSGDWGGGGQQGSGQPGGGGWNGGGQSGGGQSGGGGQPGRIRPGTVVTLQPGDVILSVNGQGIRGTQDYWRTVKASPEVMHFTLQSAGDGNVYQLKTRLFNVSADSRFGVLGQQMRGRPGVVVRSVRQGYPGTRCEVVK